MNIRIEAAQGGELPLTSALPSSLQHLRIPDSISRCAEGPFGHMLIQQLDGVDITILCYDALFHENFEMIYEDNADSIRLQIALRNSLYTEPAGLGKMILHERGINLHYLSSAHSFIQLERHIAYRWITICYPVKYLLPLQASIPGLMIFIAKAIARQAARAHAQYVIADAETLSVVDNILECAYHGNLRNLYLENLALELLLLALAHIDAGALPGAGIISEEDVQLIYRAREQMINELGGNISVSSLAASTGVSVYKLNAGFKAVYGVGVMDLLHELRMKRAHQVLAETEMTIGAIANLSGYTHPHAFSLAFKKYFGYTPAFVQRSGKTHGSIHE